MATAQVKRGANVVFVGDSITAQGWMSVAGGFIDQINAQIPIITAPRVAKLANGAVPATIIRAPGEVVTVAPVSTQQVIRTVNSGHSGDETGDIAAAVTARITSFAPDVIVLLIGINDVFFGVNPAVSQANYDSILSQIRAWSSTVVIACLSVLTEGEQWAAGPVWSNSGPNDDAAIDSFNAFIQTLCTTYNATYVDVRSQMLTYEAAHNTPAPGVASGVLTVDRIHPNATGQVQVSTYAIQSFTVVPNG